MTINVSLQDGEIECAILEYGKYLSDTAGTQQEKFILLQFVTPAQGLSP